ncbi:MAG: YlxR family protein [Dehalococcoidia bacterium]|nr:YlxR family protein [Dehalococcoidia bacterium]
MKTAQALRPRRVPVRTCVGCRVSEGKRGLVRVVRTPDGRVAVDLSGKANGRGAYVHEERTCWENALRGGKIGRALRTTPALEDIEALRAFAAALPTEEGD